MRKALRRKHLLESFQSYTIVRWCSLIKVSLIKYLLHVLCGVKHLSYYYMNKDQTLHLAFFLLDGKNLFIVNCSGTSTGLLLHTLNTMRGKKHSPFCQQQQEIRFRDYLVWNTTKTVHLLLVLLCFILCFLSLRV